MKRIISCLFCIVFFVQINAQENAISMALNNNTKITDQTKDKKKGKFKLWQGWVIGANYGVVRFNGDITQYDYFPAQQFPQTTRPDQEHFYELRTGFSYTVSKIMNPWYSIETSLMKGSLAGIKRDYNSTEDYLYFSNFLDPYDLYAGGGERFEASFYELDLISKINLNTLYSYLGDYRILNYLKFEGNFGLGYNVYNTVRRNNLSESYIYSYGYEEYDGLTGGEIKKSLANQPSESVFLYGLSVSYLITSDVDINLTYNIRQGFSDKWDGSIYQSSKRNDAFSFFSFGVRYNINKVDKNPEWRSPLDRLKKDITSVFVKIDGFTDDADNDGVADAFDKNPNTPLGVAVDGSGRALDVDMDNVSDYRDADPFSNRGAQVDVNGIELDDDKDGVPNSKDLESNTPIGVMVNQFGINISNTSYVNAGGMIYFPSIYFNSGSAIVVSSNENRIATMALMLKNNPNIKLNVIGHTDNVGTSRFNKKLGLKRANAVINHLALNYNIKTDRLIATTKGEEELLSIKRQISNGLESDTREYNSVEINRRVDFQIVD